MTSLAEEDFTEFGGLVEYPTQLHKRQSEVSRGSSGRLEEPIIESVRLLDRLTSGSRSTARTESFARSQLLTAVSARSRSDRSGFKIVFVHVARLDVDTLVPLGIGHVVVPIEHVRVLPVRELANVVVVEFLPLEASDSGMPEVVRVDSLVDTRSCGTLLEDRSNSIRAQCTLLRSIVIVASVDMPQRCFVAPIDVVIVQIYAEVCPAVNDRISTNLCTLLVQPGFVWGELRAVRFDVVDVAHPELRHQGDPSARICEELDERLVTRARGRLFERTHLVFSKDVLLAHSRGTLRRKFDSFGESVVTVFGFLVEPLEQHPEGPLVAENSSAVGLESIAALILGTTEETQERADVTHLHVDQWCICAQGGVPQHTQIVNECGGGDVLIALSFVADELFDGHPVTFVDFGLVEVLPLVLELPESVVRVVQLRHNAPTSRFILGVFSLLRARCSAATDESLGDLRF